MFEKLINTGKHLANAGLHTVNRVVSSTLHALPHEEGEENANVRREKPAVFGMKTNLLRQAGLKGQDFLQERRASPHDRSGKWIPALRFTAVGSGQVIDLRTLHQPAVLFISHKENTEITAEWNSRLLGMFYPNPLPFFTANVILLDDIPLFAQPFVRRELRKVYDTIIDRWLQDAELAARWIHILPDWDAESIHTFQLSPSRPILAAVVLSPQGRMEAVIESTDPLPEIIGILRRWINF
jgi:hypothetical protein